MGPRMREDKGVGGEGWVPAPRLRGGKLSTRGRRRGRGMAMGPRMSEGTGGEEGGGGIGPRIREDKSGVFV